MLFRSSLTARAASSERASILNLLQWTYDIVIITRRKEMCIRDRISAEQFYQLLGGEPKHDKGKKRGEYTVYDSMWLLSKIIRKQFSFISKITRCV